MPVRHLAKSRQWLSRTRGQLLRFAVVGVLLVGVDFVVYRTLLSVSPASPSLWKALSFVLCTVLAYVMNRFWTFKGAGQGRIGESARFVSVYVATLALNVGVNAAVLALLPTAPRRILIAFAFATAASALGNFAGMKYYVFRDSRPVP